METSFLIREIHGQRVLPGMRFPQAMQERGFPTPESGGEERESPLNLETTAAVVVSSLHSGVLRIGREIPARNW